MKILLNPVDYSIRESYSDGGAIKQYTHAKQAERDAFYYYTQHF